ncbi:MAG: hypothetical protein CW338_06965 [Clostridiales bacterium]|nr:hypothetical protein [Clostridiales bacterium]
MKELKDWLIILLAVILIISGNATAETGTPASVSEELQPDAAITAVDESALYWETVMVCVP